MWLTGPVAPRHVRSSRTREENGGVHDGKSLGNLLGFVVENGIPPWSVSEFTALVNQYINPVDSRVREPRASSQRKPT